MRRQSIMKKLTVLLAVAALTAPGAGPFADDIRAGAAEKRKGDGKAQRAAKSRLLPVEHLVFSSTRVVNEDGVTISSKIVGDLSSETAQKARRPWTHLDKLTLVRTQAWSRSDDDRTTVYGYEVYESRNPAPIASGETELAPPEIGTRLLEELATADPGSMLPLQLDVRGLPEWDIPLAPTAFTLSARDQAEALDERQNALQQRRSLSTRLMSPVEQALASLGGEVRARGELSNWITAYVRADAVAVLAQRTDLSDIRLLRGRAVANNPDLGNVRSDSYIDARQFIDTGYTGETANPARHGFGDITVGVIEPDQLENEACFLFDGADCTGTTRLQELFRCDDFDRDGNYCEPVSDFHDNDQSANHGTLVASVILGDYSQGQGDPYKLGDDTWTAGAGHDAAFTSSHGGMAPEARLIFFGQMADNDTDDGTVTSAGFADAFDDAIDRAIDITNSSWGWNSDGSSSCELDAVAPHEQELENAFDDGIFNVVSAGNPNTPFCSNDLPTRCNTDQQCMMFGLGTCDTNGNCTGDPGTMCAVNADCNAIGGVCVAVNGACSIGSPADVPKAFAVNAVNGAENACDLSYSGCMTDPDFSANGGITAVVNGVTCPGCLSGIDLTAPNRICGTTGAGGLHGTGNSCFSGTSAAGPVVAGAAALVKDWLLSAGQTWINDPGMLHTVMLAQGDRNTHVWGDLSSTQSTIGSSDLMGMGRIKLRLLENGAGMGPWGHVVATGIFVPASGDLPYYPFGTPMPTGTNIAKCVLYQVEDMSSKSDISRVDLEVRLKDPVSGACFDAGAPTSFTRINNGTEIKKMAAITSSEVTLANRCLHVTMGVEHVTSQGVTSIVNCYYSGVEDEFSAP